jgi:hypothetical protein
LEAVLPAVPVALTAPSVLVVLVVALALLLTLSVAVLRVVWSGELEPHPPIGTTTAIRAAAASGRRFVLMCSPAGSEFH